MDAHEEAAWLSATYTPIPVIPEFVESLVETNGESKCANEDAGDEDACQEKVNFQQLIQNC